MADHIPEFLLQAEYFPSEEYCLLPAGTGSGETQGEVEGDKNESPDEPSCTTGEFRGESEQVCRNCDQFYHPRCDGMVDAVDRKKAIESFDKGDAFKEQ